MRYITRGGGAASRLTRLRSLPTKIHGQRFQVTLLQSSIELSFVVPLFNEEQVFDELVNRLRSTIESANFPCEVVLVDDGSTDETRAKIEAIHHQDTRFRAVLLSRNFGHQNAVSAGLDYARGRFVGILDGDLQDPPEVLLEFYRKLQEGYDVAYAIRRSRKENLLKRFCYWVFYRLLRCVATIEIPLDAGDFCLMSRRVVSRIQALPERQRFIRGIRSWVGFRQVAVPYHRDRRHGGHSKYTLSKLMLLAVDGLLTFSEIPLRLATLCGVCVATLSFVWGIYILVWRLLLTESSLPASLTGFATLACGMFFLGGIQLICIGILGEYVGRIHNEVKGRPAYVIDRLLGLESDAPPQQIEGAGE